jgi:UDP-2,4-diacetamido-2,4,6-trideoxy-beta-L-altropyranose hydrolase
MARSSPSLLARAALDKVTTVSIDAVPGSIADARHTINLASSIDAAWIVADGYRFDDEYQQAIKNSGYRLLIVDDYGHADHYCADFVLNQNLSAREELYRHRDPGAQLLLGPQYALLSPRFLKFQHFDRVVPAHAQKLLVTLGGSDPSNTTARVIEAVRDSSVEARVVVGGSNPHLKALLHAVHPPSTVICDSPDMPDLMAWADLAIAGAGSTSWELAFMGVPSLVLVMADNQSEVAHALASEGVSVNLGRNTDAGLEKSIARVLASCLPDQRRREAMSQRGRNLVDGEGVSRVVSRLRDPRVALREATPDDSRRLWEWANDPDARASSFKGDPIGWDSHQVWFAERLVSPTTAIFIGVTSEGEPFGQIRYDWDQRGDAEIDVFVARPARGGGLGAALIRAGAARMMSVPDVLVMHAYVKKDNLASLRTFEKAGFRLLGATTRAGQDAWHLTLGNKHE